ncbi:hypothetical protein NDU88_002638 [Pleurodeles waltl]|uniref:Uncharacterized protein n=1 Tax=Pleurodeles waltl TaxID=8319 RepID=A0AAV7T3D6_PLEWA|nr:hypothetical protein NDU88_002638 [Pleurodeles waltl]
MEAPRRHSEGLVGGPGASPGLCWLRARLELGCSRPVAAQLPFRVRVDRVSTDADRLQNEDRTAVSLKQVARRCSSSSSIRLSSGITALH